MKESELIRLCSCGSGRDTPEMSVEMAEQRLNQFRMKCSIELRGDMLTVLTFYQSKSQFVFIHPYLRLEKGFVSPQKGSIGQPPLVGAAPFVRFLTIYRLVNLVK